MKHSFKSEYLEHLLLSPVHLKQRQRSDLIITTKDPLVRLTRSASCIIYDKVTTSFGRPVLLSFPLDSILNMKNVFSTKPQRSL